MARKNCKGLIRCGGSYINPRDISVITKRHLSSLYEVYVNGTEKPFRFYSSEITPLLEYLNLEKL